MKQWRNIKLCTCTSAWTALCFEQQFSFFSHYVSHIRISRVTMMGSISLFEKNHDCDGLQAHNHVLIKKLRWIFWLHVLFKYLDSQAWFAGKINTTEAETEFSSVYWKKTGWYVRTLLHDFKKVNWNLKLNFIEYPIIKHSILSPDSLWRFCPGPVREKCR